MGSNGQKWSFCEKLQNALKSLFLTYFENGEMVYSLIFEFSQMRPCTLPGDIASLLWHDLNRQTDTQTEFFLEGSSIPEKLAHATLAHKFLIIFFFFL